ncbi:MAG: hypothetical protein IPK82_34970 [Polyangiaceae bacterium]|nr:hypothetical protein [Polyangiaceae bacterium]
MSAFSRRIVVSIPLFQLTQSIVAALRKDRDERGHDNITEKYNAFLLDPGMGPATYLSSEGRIIWDDYRAWVDLAARCINRLAGGSSDQPGARRVGSR